MLKTLIRQLFCAHDWVFHRRIEGDERLNHSFRRELWRCTKCWRFAAR